MLRRASGCVAKREWPFRVGSRDNDRRFGAVLYLGPPAAITFAPPVRWPCDAPAFVERLRRMSLSPLLRGVVDRLKQNCVG
jgi:hypothetical protein